MMELLKKMSLKLNLFAPWSHALLQAHWFPSVVTISVQFSFYLYTPDSQQKTSYDTQHVEPAYTKLLLLISYELEKFFLATHVGMLGLSSIEV